MIITHWHSPKTSTYYPTGGPLLYQGWELLEKEWKTSMGSTPTSTMTVTIHQPQATVIGDMAVINAYENVIDTDLKTNAQTISQFRVTRVVQKIEGKWLIIHDHVSQFPRNNTYSTAAGQYTPCRTISTALTNTPCSLQ